MYQTIIKKHEEIHLEESTHTYTLLKSGIEFNSVTEFINTFFTPFEEEKIAKKLSGKGKYQNMSHIDILNDWENRRNRGTIIHKEIENFINNISKTRDLEEFDTKSKQAILFLEKECLNTDNLLFPEVKICAEKLKLAGTIDLMIYSKKNDQIYLIDWKTNVEIKKKGYNKGIHFPTTQIEDCSFNRYQLQLSFYQYMLENFYNTKVGGLYIVHLKDNSYTTLKCAFEKNHVSSMLQKRIN